MWRSCAWPSRATCGGSLLEEERRCGRTDRAPGAHGQPAVQHMDKSLVNHVAHSALAGGHLRCVFEPGPSHGRRALRAYWTRSILIHAWLSVRSVHMPHLLHTRRPPDASTHRPPSTKQPVGGGDRARHRIEEAGAWAGEREDGRGRKKVDRLCGRTCRPEVLTQCRSGVHMDLNLGGISALKARQPAIQCIPRRLRVLHVCVRPACVQARIPRTLPRLTHIHTRAPGVRAAPRPQPHTRTTFDRLCEAVQDWWRESTA